VLNSTFVTLLDENDVRDFQQAGFVLTPDLLTRDELAQHGTAIDRIVAERTARDSRSLSEKSTYEQSFTQCMRLWETNEEIRPLTFHPDLARAACELLGVPSVRMWQDQALYKEPGGRITDPHQDATFWPVGDAPMVSAWIPLDASTVENGAVAYVPGSHRVGRLKVVNLLHTTEPYDILRDPALAGEKPVTVEAPVGSVVWHHGLTVHEAFPNQSEITRRAFTIVYIADGWRRQGSGQFFPLDRAGVRDGDLIAGDGLPVAWPREPGDWPEPPSIIGSGTGPQMVAEP
jgi:ectoine hydroxylase-related dioxygenase (phytanoyl-CoA dioxygenase family)